MFGEKSLLLLFNNVSLVLVEGHLLLSLSELDGALLFVDDELLLPKTLNFTSVFKLTHTSLLLSHLLKTLIFSKLSQQLGLKVLLEALLFSFALSL